MPESCAILCLVISSLYLYYIILLRVLSNDSGRKVNCLIWGRADWSLWLEDLSVAVEVYCWPNCKYPVVSMYSVEATRFAMGGPT